MGSGPNGITVANISVTASGAFTAAYTLPQVTDLRNYDTFNFAVNINRSRLGLVVLVDSSSRRRWYNLDLRVRPGWKQPVYSLTNFVGQDQGFDLSQVAALWFDFNHQALYARDQLSIGAISFDVGLVDHGDYSSNWVQDLTCGGTISTSSDTAVGLASLLANVQACPDGQVDIAINAIDYMALTWNWSNMSYISFYYKDNYPSMQHYFGIYDHNHNWRSWLFPNSYPGQWMKITAPLTTGYWRQSGTIDFSSIIQFEVGIFNGPPNQNYTFQIDEVALYPSTN